MKTIDLSREKHTLDELLTLAKTDTVLIHTVDGNEFFIEEADEFEREVATLGSSDKFMSFLGERSREERDISIEDAAKKRGIENL
jgi:hypothetical protein